MSDVFQDLFHLVTSSKLSVFFGLFLLGGIITLVIELFLSFSPINEHKIYYNSPPKFNDSLYKRPLTLKPPFLYRFRTHAGRNLAKLYKSADDKMIFYMEGKREQAWKQAEREAVDKVVNRMDPNVYPSERAKFIKQIRKKYGNDWDVTYIDRRPIDNSNNSTNIDIEPDND